MWAIVSFCEKLLSLRYITREIMEDLFGNAVVEPKSSNLEKKVAFAVKLIQSAYKKARENDSDLEIAYSGGKDSDVILELARMSGVPFRAIYKNTTIDPAGTPAHARAQGCEVIMPKWRFEDIIAHYGFPNRFRRHCCKVLKEYKVLDYAVLGIRQAESTKRAQRYKEPEQCRVYSKKSKVRQYFPILYWTDADVADFIALRGIKCHNKYYDDMGHFHVERRLGCVGCPLQNFDMRISEFKAHPQMVNLYLRGGKRYMETHPDMQYSNVYEWFVRDVFCETQGDYERIFKGRLFADSVDCKKFLADYFNIKIV